MNHRRAVVMLIPVALMAGACGSSSPSSASSVQSDTHQVTTTASGSVAAGTTTTAGASAKRKQPVTGSTNVRVPATFVVRPGGRLDPSQISVPAFLAVQVSVVSRDGRSHHVVLATPSRKSLSVPANGEASIRIHGMRAGRYALELDGSRAGALVTGAQPGP